jgi:Apea-like HEPN
LSMIQLHPDCRARLIQTIADAIPFIVVTNGKFISYSSLPAAKLITADNVIPTRGTVRDQLTTYINETPVSTFVVDQLQGELQSKQYQQDRPSMNLTEIGGYEDPNQIAERLVDQINSLPWQYKLTIRLPQQLVPLLPPSENSIVLSDQIKLVRADDSFQKLYPLETDGGLVGLGGLLRPSWSGEPSAEHMQITVNGFIGPYGGSTPAWRAECILRAFCGLGIALRLFKVTHKYSGPFGPKPSSHFIVHRQVSDQSWRFEGQQNLSDDRSRALDSLEREQFEEDFDVKGFTNYTLSQMRAVFSNGSKADPIVLASEWFFDSYTGNDQLLSYVQAMVVLEILLGDKAASDEIGLGRLLSNRCAYLISKTQKERTEFLHDFDEVYRVRSEIIHRGKSRLAHDERALFYKLQWFCHRVIQEEIELLKPRS